MKALWNGLRGAIGKGLAPIRRPLVRRLDDHVNRLLNDRLSAELEARLVPTLSAALATTAQTVNRLDSLIAQTNHSTEETDQALNTLLEEVIRLREQVELLHQLVPQARRDAGSGEVPSSSLSLLDHDETCCEAFADEPEAERARVG